MADSIPAEKELVKELKRMAERLKAVDEQPDQDLSLDEANDILGTSAFVNIQDLFLHLLLFVVGVLGIGSISFHSLNR